MVPGGALVLAAVRGAASDIHLSRGDVGDLPERHSARIYAPQLLTGQQLGEVTPVRGDEEKYAREREGDAGDDRSSGTLLESRDLGCREPDPCEQDEQESDFREAHARVMRQSDGVHAGHSSCVANPCRDSARPRQGQGSAAR
jgi:hypothetical protein